jgi:hypothetical protein
MTAHHYFLPVFLLKLPIHSESLYEDYGAQNCLQPVDPDIVQNLMDELGGEDVIRFVSVAYAARAQEVFDSLDVPKITFKNVWKIFQTMLPYLSN